MEKDSFRVLELYSGIGGMHSALQESGVMYEVVRAIDINPTANKVYRHNFPQVNLTETGIEALTVKQMDKMKIDMILMSPPCQPFTRVGKKLDTSDLRTKSFLHLLNILPRLTHCPSYILVENVKGFEVSQTREALVQALKICYFDFQEFLLTPLQFGIPNSRLRYYLIAKRKPHQFSFTTSSVILEDIPSFAERWMTYKTKKKVSHKTKEELSLTNKTSKDLFCADSNTSDMASAVKDTTEGTCDYQGRQFLDKPEADCTETPVDRSDQGRQSLDCPKADKIETVSLDNTAASAAVNMDIYKRLLDYGHNMRQLEDDDHRSFPDCLDLGHFLEMKPLAYFEEFMLPNKDLIRFIVMDIVHPCMNKTSCFTKRYGHFMEGAGSIVQSTTDIKSVEMASQFKDRAVKLKNREDWGEEELSILQNLQLRYFTPREIANLLCFPKSYDFPQDVSRIQLYRTLGNSLNVHVVSILIQILTSNDLDTQEEKKTEGND